MKQQITLTQFLFTTYTATYQLINVRNYFVQIIETHQNFFKNIF